MRSLLLWPWPGSALARADGQTPLELAKQGGHDAAVRALLSAGGAPKAKLASPSLGDKGKRLQRLRQQSIFLNKRGASGTGNASPSRAADAAPGSHGP